MLEPFVIAFALALVSEIADKTQLVILALALKYKSPFKVFFGALSAHAIMDGIAIALGSVFGFSIPFALVKTVTGALFVALGIWTFVKLQMKKSKRKKGMSIKGPLLASFLTVLASEFGDKTQIASGLLAAKYLAPVPIFIGFVLALAIAIGFNVFIGSKLSEKIPRRQIKIITGVLFILFGILSLLG